jgi:hypothetical protein
MSLPPTSWAGRWTSVPSPSWTPPGCSTPTTPLIAVADRDACPDVAVFTDGRRDTLQTLTNTVSQAAVPAAPWLAS